MPYFSVARFPYRPVSNIGQHIKKGEKITQRWDEWPIRTPTCFWFATISPVHHISQFSNMCDNQFTLSCVQTGNRSNSSSQDGCQKLRTSWLPLHTSRWYVAPNLICMCVSLSQYIVSYYKIQKVLLYNLGWFLFVMVQEKRVVSAVEGFNMASKLGCYAYIECSTGTLSNHCQ